MKTNGAAASVLHAWYSANPKAPRSWRDIAQKLAEHDEMVQAWPELTKRRIEPMPFFSTVCKAYEAAQKEVSRQQLTEETQQINGVKRAIQNLKSAIETSPLPPNTATLFELQSETRQTIPVLIGWRDLRADGYGLGYSVSIVETLDIALMMVQKFEANLPPRALKRHRKQPETAAFVRWLNWYMLERFKAAPLGTIGRVTTAIFDLKNPLDKADIQAILKDAPAEFLPLKRRPRSP